MCYVWLGDGFVIQLSRIDQSDQSGQNWSSLRRCLYRRQRGLNNWQCPLLLRRRSAPSERENTAWKEIVGQREVQVIGWSKAIDWRSKFDWKLGIGRGGVIDRKLHPLCMVHNTDPIGGLGWTGKFGPGVMVAFSFGPFVAAAENGGSMRVGRTTAAACPWSTNQLRIPPPPNPL
ncbi:uncharacterized protein K444DRAFT_250927 [Hyaloscypha bicolor E]|uniref:Uncharacterized protein n=1 Tax=Hyaloscypha bicolor E TaxID=1095630 RepID=A0A2J6SMR9_9HELO|nr:uncharacterized protein K444DRAFT_250927 [Hyaloscypha bicolor E]PMD52055.1 hypothetical protein K444DRAFT_250927 [Hyaloscypha bicolor E]